jgi:hypothetical protein
MKIKSLFLAGFIFIFITSSAWGSQEDSKTCECYGCDGVHAGVCSVLYTQSNCDSNESCFICCGNDATLSQCDSCGIAEADLTLNQYLLIVMEKIQLK